jgi:glycosyltransferase involved in cell wall biosynthesis
MSAELEHVLACLSSADEFDLVHDHSGLLAVSLAASVPTPLVHTAHGPFTGPSGELYRSALAFNPRARLISLTKAQQHAAPDLPWIANCPNAIEVESFPFRAQPGTYLAFVGRMSYEKGVREAIEVAQAAGCELRIAAKCREPAEREYFREYVEPHLGHGVEYLGELGHAAKAELLASALALVFPINWDEPFGLVLAEAAACGTPVVALRRGSVPEVVDDGVTGFAVDTLQQMADAVAKVETLDRARIRRHAEEQFSVPRMVDDYLDAYELASRGAETQAPLAARV